MITCYSIPKTHSLHCRLLHGAIDKNLNSKYKYYEIYLDPTFKNSGYYIKHGKYDTNAITPALKGAIKYQSTSVSRIMIEVGKLKNKKMASGYANHGTGEYPVIQPQKSITKTKLKKSTIKMIPTYNPILITNEDVLSMIGIMVENEKKISEEVNKQTPSKVKTRLKFLT